MINKFLLTAAFTVCFMAAQAANAVVVVGLTSTQTLNFAPTATGASQTLTFNRFNQGTLGAGTRFLLTGVRITYTPAAAGTLSTVTVISNSGNKRTLIDTVTATTTLSSSAFTTFGGNIRGVSDVLDFNTSILSGNAQNVVRTANISYSAVSPITAPTITNVAPYVGTGSISVTKAITNIVNTITTPSGGAGNASFQSGDYKGTFQIIYTYNDLLPEPGSWATMILGFGAIGVAMRRRRTALA